MPIGWRCEFTIPQLYREVWAASYKDATRVFIVLTAVIIGSQFLYRLTDWLTYWLPSINTYDPVRDAVFWIYNKISVLAVLTIEFFLTILDFFGFLLLVIPNYLMNLALEFPKLYVPSWYGDLAVPSILLSRLFSISDEIIPTSMRAGEQKKLLPVDQDILRSAGHPIIWWPWYLTDRLNQHFYWDFLMNPIKDTILPFCFGGMLKKLGLKDNYIDSVFRNISYTVGGLFLVAYPKLLGYVLFFLKNRNLSYSVIDNYKRWLNSVVALLLLIAFLSGLLVWCGGPVLGAVVEAVMPSVDKYF